MTIPYLAYESPIRVAFQRVLQNIFVQAVLVALFFTALTYTLAYFAGWVSGTPNWWEIGAAGLNYGATFLTIKQRRFSYLLGIGASAIYGYVYGSAGLLASAALSLYLTGSLIFGYFRWGKDANTRPVHRIRGWWWAAYIGATAVFFAGAYATVVALGGNFAPWDAAILVLTVLAQFMLDTKVIETWFVWTLVNIVGVTIYFQSELYFAAMQQLIFGVANLWGFLAWRRAMLIDQAKERHPANGRKVALSWVDEHSFVSHLPDNDMRVQAIDNPLDYREDQSIRPGDPAYLSMMEVLLSGQAAVFNQKDDGTWEKEPLNSNKARGHHIQGD